MPRLFCSVLISSCICSRSRLSRAAMGSSNSSAAGLNTSGPCQRHPLLLPAGKLAGLTVTHVAQPHPVQGIHGALAPFRAWAPSASGGQIPRFQGHSCAGTGHSSGKPRPGSGPVGGSVSTGSPSMRTDPEVCSSKPGHHHHGGGLAGTARTQQGNKLAGLDRQVQLVNGNDVAVVLADLAEFNGALGGGLGPRHLVRGNH